MLKHSSPRALTPSSLRTQGPITLGLKSEERPFTQRRNDNVRRRDERNCARARGPFLRACEAISDVILRCSPSSASLEGCCSALYYAAILRDAAKTPLLRMTAEIVSQARSQGRRMKSWLVCLLLVTGLPAHAQDRLKLVTSFSILGDFAKNVSGDRVEVATLVGANGDVHVYTPAPADAKKIADAKLVIINGLGLEGWLPRLVQSSGSKARIVTATDGIAPRVLGVADDPHAWQSVANAKVYVANIRDALMAADPADDAVFRANADGYLAKLDGLDRDVRRAREQTPP